MTLDNEKKKCPDHKVQYQGGDPSHSDFGCDNCEDDAETIPEEGTGA